MKIYLKNTDTLKPRIKKLKESLCKLHGVSPSLGLCRDMVAQSLNWSNWNELYLAHEKLGSVHDRVLFTGRWYDGESNKEDARANLVKLMSTEFGEHVTSLEDFTALAMLVWPKSTFDFNHTNKKGKPPALPIGDVPHHYLRDNILVDVDTQASFDKFTQTHTLPFVSMHGGIIFCKPAEAKGIIKYFHDRGEQHGVVVTKDYSDLVEDSMFFETTTRHHVIWEHHADNLTLDTLEHILHQYTEGKIRADDRAAYRAWLSGEINEGDTLTIDAFGAQLCPHIHESSHEIINRIVERLPEEQLEGAPISLTQITNPPYPIVIISHSEDFLGHVVLSAFMRFIRNEADKIRKREKSISSEKAPSLLALGLGDQITLDGFAVETSYAGSANWSVMVSQYSERIAEHQYVGTEMPAFVANVMNIFRLIPRTIKQRLLMQPEVSWYCVRNGRGDLQDVMRSMSQYGERDFSLKTSVPPIPIKLS